MTSLCPLNSFSACKVLLPSGGTFLLPRCHLYGGVTNVSLWDDSEDINEMNKNYELIFGSTICDEIRSIAGEQIDRQIEEYIDKLEQRELNKTRLDMLIDEIIGDPSVTAALKQVADTLSVAQQADEEKTE